MKLDFFYNNCNLLHDRIQAALVEKKKEICFAGYVLRLCPFEDVAMVGLAADDVEAFLQVVKFSSNFLIPYLYFYTPDHTFPLLKIS